MLMGHFGPSKLNKGSKLLEAQPTNKSKEGQLIDELVDNIKCKVFDQARKRTRRFKLYKDNFLNKFNTLGKSRYTCTKFNALLRFLL